MSTFDWDYDYSNIQLPNDGSAPQPVIPVSDGLQCKQCSASPFKTSSQKRLKVHGNQEHGLKGVDHDKLGQKVRLQSWFQDHRQGYWVVDESKKESGQVRVIQKEGEEYVGHTSIDEEDNDIKETIEVDKIVETVDKIVRVADSDDEVFSDFDDSGDEDY